MLYQNVQILISSYVFGDINFFMLFGFSNKLKIVKWISEALVYLTNKRIQALWRKSSTLTSQFIEVGDLKLFWLKVIPYLNFNIELYVVAVKWTFTVPYWDAAGWVSFSGRTFSHIVHDKCQLSLSLPLSQQKRIFGLANNCIELHILLTKFTQVLIIYIVLSIRHTLCITIAAK